MRDQIEDGLELIFFNQVSTFRIETCLILKTLKNMNSRKRKVDKALFSSPQKKQKFFKISCHIESYVTCMKY